MWYGAWPTRPCRKSLQRIVRAAEKIDGVSLPSLQDIYTPVSPAKPSALQVIPPTRHTTSSVCCHQGGELRSPPGEDQQTKGQLHPSGCQEAELPSRPCPPAPPLFTPRNTDFYIIIIILFFSTCPLFVYCNSCNLVYVCIIYIYIYILCMHVCYVCMYIYISIYIDI